VQIHRKGALILKIRENIPGYSGHSAHQRHTRKKGKNNLFSGPGIAGLCHLMSHIWGVQNIEISDIKKNR
jgi:hypothetical protein